MKAQFQPILILSLSALLVSIAEAQPGRGRGFGPPPGRGPGARNHQGGHGHGMDERHDEDHEVFQFLLTNHKKIQRTVKELPNGVETLTESKDPKIAAKIKEHVKWMEYRVENVKPIRMRDPLFAALFQNAKKIKMVRKETENGVRVTETSDDPQVAKLIQAHAKVVSGFVERGFAEAMKQHPVAGAPAEELNYSHPSIKKFGKVVKLPEAAHQPRSNSQIVVDLTKGGAADELYGSIEKVARFVNIYSGAGKQPAKVDIAVILHGDATLAALNPDAYGKQYKTTGNPNLECLHELHEAGVQIYVCGQSLVSKGGKPSEVVPFVDVAVSALTTLVNLQADGYSYVPLK
ncbi:MAG: DsrE family protein [Planctomycetaceae bacterium]|nr:DsrE family protein [Planctomycetaceae bacterium]